MRCTVRCKWRKIITVSILLSLFCMLSTCTLASDGNLRQEIQLGPLFTGMFDQEAVYSASFREKQNMEKYGGIFARWPHEVREETSRTMEAMMLLPKGLLCSRIPPKEGLNESEIAELAWTALINHYPLDVERQEWYRESCALMYGTKDNETEYWWATYLPYYTANPFIGIGEIQLEKSYTIQMNAHGLVVDIIERNATPYGSLEVDINDEALSPFSSLIIYIDNLLRSNYPRGRMMTLEENLDYNVMRLFPSVITSGSMMGLPSQEHIIQDDAVAIAVQRVTEEYNAIIDENNFFIQSSFIIVGKPVDLLFEESAYPMWSIAFFTDGSILCYSVFVSGTTGDIISSAKHMED